MPVVLCGSLLRSWNLRREQAVGFLYVNHVATLETFLILAVHISVIVHIALTSRACFEVHHYKTSVDCSAAPLPITLITTLDAMGLVSDFDS